MTHRVKFIGLRADVEPLNSRVIAMLHVGAGINSSGLLSMSYLTQLGPCAEKY